MQRPRLRSGFAPAESAMPAMFDTIEADTLGPSPGAQVRLAGPLLARLSGAQLVDDAWAAGVARRIVKAHASFARQ